MKKLLVLIACLVATAVWAQTNPAGNPIPPDLWNTNIKDWQLNGVTLWLIITNIGRAAAALKAGDGIVGIIKGILFGTNTPIPPKEGTP